MADKRLSLIVDLVNKTEAGFKSIYADLDAAQKRTENTTRAMKEIGAVGVAAFAAVGLATRNFLKDGAELEGQTIAFTTMLGSAEKAANMLKQLTAFAAKTPFEVQGIRDTAKQLLAMGISSEALLPTLKSLGDVAAGLSQPIQRIAYVFGQVRTTGKLLGGDLMQFTQAGVPLLETLATQFGKTTAEVRAMISEGKVGFPDVAKAMASMSGEGGKFFNMMEKQSFSLNGQISNLKDNMTKMSETIGTALIPVAKDITQALLGITQVITAWVQKNPELAATIIKVTLAFAALMVVTGAWGLAAPRVVATIGMLSGAFSTLTKVITFLRTTTLAQAWASIAGAGVAAMTALRGATMSLVASLVTLRGALMATGIGAIIVMIGIAGNAFLELKDIVGGFGNAFQFVWLNIKKMFYDVMGSMMQGLASLFEKIPGLGDLAQTMVDGFAEMSAEADAGMNDIIASADSAGSAAAQMATTFDMAGQDILSGYGDMALATDTAGEAAKKYFESLVDGIAGIRDEIRSTYDDITKATQDFNKSVGQENQSYEDEVVDKVAGAQNKKLDLQKQLKDAKKKDNEDEIADIKASIAEQDSIIKSYQKSRLDLDSEVAARRKYLNMNELDQLTYDHKQKLKMMKDEYLQEQAQRLQKIVNLMTDHNTAMNLVAADKRANLEAELAKKVAFQQRLADEKAGLTTWIAQTTSMYNNYVSAVNASLSKLKSSPGMSVNISGSSKSGSRASGGPVQAGRTFLVGEKGPELFTPQQSGRVLANGMGGGNVTLVFQGNTFMDDEYYDKIQKRIVQDLKNAMRISVG